MQRCITIGLLLFCSLALISWGVKGHRTIGIIAASHLTPQASARVRDLLGSQSLAEVSTWADEVRNMPQYAYTKSWHYLDLPKGLSYVEFEKKVLASGENTIYGAIRHCKSMLTNDSVSREKKIENLKFLVHFIGDLHQPMHISRAEDKGGNTIQLNFNGKGMNLHSLWDTGLIEQQHMSEQQMAEKYDHLDADSIRKLQGDSLVKWMWESYEISSKLYAEVEAMSSRAVGESYYQAHLGIVQARLEVAGIRLAGVLNQVFDKQGNK